MIVRGNNGAMVNVAPITEIFADNFEFGGYSNWSSKVP